MVALAVDADERSPLFPNAPTLAELGYKDSMPRTYLGLVVPAGTSKQIIAKVHDDVAGIMNEPDFRKRHLTDRGLEPVVSTPAQFAQFIERERVDRRRLLLLLECLDHALELQALESFDGRIAQHLNFPSGFIVSGSNRDRARCRARASRGRGVRFERAVDRDRSRGSI